MAKRKFEIDDPQLVTAFSTAFSHKLRITIFLLYANGARASAKMFAEDGLAPLANCSYHLAKLRDLGAITVVKENKRRGAIERQCEITKFGIELVEWAEDIGRGPRGE